MPQPIYLPRQPTFMDQFSPYMDNIMKSIMMGVQNRRADEETARGYLDSGYSEVQPVPQSQQAASPQNAAEQTAFESGPRGEYWKQHAPADVTVGGRGPFNGGLMGMPKRGFRKPVEPKMTYKAVKDKETGRAFLEVYKDEKLSKVSAMSQASKDAGTKYQKKIKYFKGKNGKAMAQATIFDPKLGQEVPLGNPYEVMRGTGGAGGGIQFVGLDTSDPKGVKAVSYNKKTGQLTVSKPAKGLEKIEKKTTNVEQISRNVAKAKSLIQENPKAEGTKAHIEYLQKHDNSDTVYRWKTKPQFTIMGKGFGSKSQAEAVKLPIMNGKQVTTQDIRDTMKAEKMTFEQVLEHILNAKSR